MSYGDLGVRAWQILAEAEGFENLDLILEYFVVHNIQLLIPITVSLYWSQ